MGIYAFLLLVVPAVGSAVLAASSSSVLGPLFRTYVIFYTALISSVVFYRLSPFHPLAKYPGPTSAKVSKLWFVSTHGNVPQHSGLILRLSGVPGLARKAVRSLQEPSQEVRGCRSCRYVNLCPESPNSFEPYTRTK